MGVATVQQPGVFSSPVGGRTLRAHATLAIQWLLTSGSWYLWYYLHCINVSRSYQILDVADCENNFATQKDVCKSVGDVVTTPYPYNTGPFTPCFCCEVLMTSSGYMGSTEESRTGSFTAETRSLHTLCRKTQITFFSHCLKWNQLNLSGFRSVRITKIIFALLNATIMIARFF